MYKITLRERTVKLRRKDREKDSDFALNVTDQCPYAVLSMITPDGMPYCIPLSIVRDVGNIYFHSAKEGFKTDCLRAAPDVCLCCAANVIPAEDKFTTGFDSAVIRGRASEVTDRDEKIHALELIARKYTPQLIEKLPEALERSLERTAIWKISIDSIT